MKRILSLTEMNEGIYYDTTVPAKVRNYRNEAYNFCKDTLKMGTKDNLFDKFIKKNKLNPNDLATLISAVVVELNENWL